METNKQTAVEWLIKSLEKHEHDFEKGFTSLDDYIINVKWVKDQSKVMEKDQIIDFTRKAVRKIFDEDRQTPFNLELYYEETYEE
jgi:lipoate-protein ligase A